MRRIERVEEEISELDKRISHLGTEQRKMPNVVSCEKCGCLVDRTIATTGEGEIRIKESIWLENIVKEEYIYYPYYCKIHKLKGK